MVYLQIRFYYYDTLGFYTLISILCVCFKKGSLSIFKFFFRPLHFYWGGKCFIEEKNYEGRYVSKTKENKIFIYYT